MKPPKMLQEIVTKIQSATLVHTCSFCHMLHCTVLFIVIFSFVPNAICTGMLPTLITVLQQQMQNLCGVATQHVRLLVSNPGKAEHGSVKLTVKTFYPNFYIRKKVTSLSW